MNLLPSWLRRHSDSSKREEVGSTVSRGGLRFRTNSDDSSTGSGVHEHYHNDNDVDDDGVGSLNISTDAAQQFKGSTPLQPFTLRRRSVVQEVQEASQLFMRK